LLVALLQLTSITLANGWTEVNKGTGFLLYGISAQSSSSIYVAGIDFTSGLAVIQHSTNGGTTFSNNTVEKKESLDLRDISVSSSGQGVACGVGLPTIPGIAVSTDGNTWTQAYTSHFLESSFLNCGVLSGDNSFVTGQWADLLQLDGEGVQVTGKHGFTSQDWGISLGARFGSFLNNTYGFVSGGSVPPIGPTPYKKGFQMSDYHFFDFKTKSIVEIADSSKHYEGIIGRWDGKNWDFLFNTTTLGYSMYFNGLSFVSSTQGWVVSVENNNGTRSSSIWNTADGGQSWTEQYSEDDLHLYGVQCTSVNNCWAWGYKAPDLTLFGSYFLQTTDGGKKWSNNAINDVIVFDLSEASDGSVFATAFGLDFATNVYKNNS